MLKKSHQHKKVKVLLNVRMKLRLLSKQNVQTELREQTAKNVIFVVVKVLQSL